MEGPFGSLPPGGGGGGSSQPGCCVGLEDLPGTRWEGRGRGAQEGKQTILQAWGRGDENPLGCPGKHLSQPSPARDASWAGARARVPSLQQTRADAPPRAQLALAFVSKVCPRRARLSVKPPPPPPGEPRRRRAEGEGRAGLLQLQLQLGFFFFS